MYIIPLQVIALYLISEYLHRSLAYGSRTLYVILMLPGTIAHELSHALMALLMGSRITQFSVIPSWDTLGHVEYTQPKIPLIGNAAISIAPLFGCPALLLIISNYFGVHINYPPASFDLIEEIRIIFDATFSFIIGLDYFNWKTYVFLYFILTLGSGAAPSKTDILNMLPGLVFIAASIYVLNYFGVKIIILNNIFSWLSAALTIAIIPLLAAMVIIAMLKLIAVIR